MLRLKDLPIGTTWITEGGIGKQAGFLVSHPSCVWFSHGRWTKTVEVGSGLTRNFKDLMFTPVELV